MVRLGNQSHTVLHGKVLRTSDKAALFLENGDDDGDEFWIPRSQMEDGDEVDVGDTEAWVAKWWLGKNR